MAVSQDIKLAGDLGVVFIPGIWFFMMIILLIIYFAIAGSPFGNKRKWNQRRSKRAKIEKVILGITILFVILWGIAWFLSNK